MPIALASDFSEDLEDIMSVRLSSVEACTTDYDCNPTQGEKYTCPIEPQVTGNCINGECLPGPELVPSLCHCFSDVDCNTGFYCSNDGHCDGKPPVEVETPKDMIKPISLTAALVCGVILWRKK